jgi:sugar/nucleoside kinase (ribokinase family)
MKKYQICGLGNNIVDILVKVDDQFLSNHGLQKASMRLVTEEEQHKLLIELSSHRPSLRNGGSVGNSIASFSELGGKASWISCVGDDAYGDMFLAEYRDAGIALSNNSGLKGQRTGTSLVLITPDAERTMRTSLAVSGKLSEQHANSELIADSEYCFIEGYVLANPEYGHGAALKALEICRRSGTKVILTLSEAFVIEHHRKICEEVISRSSILFANQSEAAACCGENNPAKAAETLSLSVPHVIVTAGSEGAFVAENGKAVHIPSVPCVPVDLTGAGDMFAAGYLYGHLNGYNIANAGKLATFLSSKVITKLGARLDENLRSLVESNQTLIA